MREVRFIADLRFTTINCVLAQWSCQVIRRHFEAQSAVPGHRRTPRRTMTPHGISTSRPKLRSDFGPCQLHVTANPTQEYFPCRPVPQRGGSRSSRAGDRMRTRQRRRARGDRRAGSVSDQPARGRTAHARMAKSCGPGTQTRYLLPAQPVDPAAAFVA
jgi:hypothetical protein